jgi:hypothetical protein
MNLARTANRKLSIGWRPRRPELRQPTIVLFGDSHCYAVQRAIEKRQGKGRPVPLAAHRLLKIKNGRQQGDTSFEAFLEIIRSFQADDVVLSMIGGNQHAVFSTIQHPQRFDFLQPGDAQVTDGTEIIPYRILAESFSSGIRNGDGKSLRALRAATEARVVHIIPPPPKGDNEFIQQHHESVFANEGIAARGVSSPALRLKFWSLQTRVLEDLCRESGIEMMMPPATARDKAGFLARDYYAEDATHGNWQYGELVLREIESRYASEPAGVGDGA